MPINHITNVCVCVCVCSLLSFPSFLSYKFEKLFRIFYPFIYIYVDDSLMPTLILNIDIYESLNKAQLRDTLIRICVYMCKYIFLEVECRIIEVYLRSSVRILSVPREAIENTLHSREPIAISEFYAY